MPIFDRYIAVDWSANNAPKSGRDSIWIAETGEPSVNPRTRHAAMQHLLARLEKALQQRERTFVGFDFPFGYPTGAAARLADANGWAGLWATLSNAIVDDPNNRSNRFEVAAALNARMGGDGPRFWGCPVARAGKYLTTRKHGISFDSIAEYRTVERVANGAKSTWQLFYNGSVGSQCLLGLAHLQRLRTRFAGKVAVWPFETDFEQRLDAPIILAEIYPSLDRHDPDVHPKDLAQVEAQVRRFAALDASGEFATALSLPAGYADKRDVLLAEEGWIVGAGHEALRP